MGAFQSPARRRLCGVIVATVLLAPGVQAGGFRSIDGSGNNIANPDWGEADTRLLRLTTPAYEDGASVPRGGDPSTLPSPRAISNAVADQSGPVNSGIGASDWLWQWGQFLDHDIDLTGGATPAEHFNIPVPTGDPFFDPFNTGTQEIGLERSLFDPSTGTPANNPRQQINEITSYIDASNVYGSDAARAAALRTFTDGKLATSTGNNGETLMLFNTAGLPNAGGPSPNLFLGGDVRANEQIGLTAVHTLFVREHNRLAEDIKTRLDPLNPDPELVAKRDAFVSGGGTEDEFIYQTTRKVVGAQMQIITYQEWLPTLLGGGALLPFAGYDDTVNAGISNEFSTAAFRVGHTMLSPELQRIDGAGVDQGAVALRDAFFNPSLAVNDGIDALLLGLASQQAQEVDTLIIDDVRNFLFGPPGAGGFDLASLNIQRGRDHGLAAINAVRAELGLPVYQSFLELTGGDTDLAMAFDTAYDSIDEVDLWIGGLAESHVGGGVVGETFRLVLADQFARLRDGDRFFYLNAGQLLHLEIVDPEILDTRLSDIIRRNTGITDIQDNVFFVARVIEPPVLLLALGALVMAARGRRRGAPGAHAAGAAVHAPHHQPPGRLQPGKHRRLRKAGDGARRACELSQRGLHTAPLTAGVLMPEEYPLKRFHDWVRARL